MNEEMVYIKNRLEKLMQEYELSCLNMSIQKETSTITVNIQITFEEKE